MCKCNELIWHIDQSLKPILINGFFMEYDKEQITIKSIKKYINFKKKTVLEIGCGNGNISSLLADGTENYIGIDPDNNAIIKAKSKFSNIDFRIGNGESLEFEDSIFDVVLFTLSLHHQNASIALKEADRVLTKTGALLIIEPSCNGELQQFFNLFNDETNKINETFESRMNSCFILTNQDTFNAMAKFNNQAELCTYHFDRERIGSNDCERIIKKLQRLQISYSDHQPIFLNDKINIYHLKNN